MRQRVAGDSTRHDVIPIAASDIDWDRWGTSRDRFFRGLLRVIERLHERRAFSIPATVDYLPYGHWIVSASQSVPSIKYSLFIALTRAHWDRWESWEVVPDPHYHWQHSRSAWNWHAFVTMIASLYAKHRPSDENFKGGEYTRGSVMVRAEGPVSATGVTFYMPMRRDYAYNRPELE